jgi:putative transposase
LRKNNEWWLHITVAKEMEYSKLNLNRVIAIDIGDKNIATKVELIDGKVKNPKFYGREVRGIRRHFYRLRRKLGEKKLLKVIKRIGGEEHRKVNDVLHKISKEIVDRAKELRATIVIGNLKGIRRKRRNRTLNRIVNRMPYYRLTRYIRYKAEWEGVPVLLIPEYNTSKTCYRCGKEGKRLNQARFKCPNCGLDYFNADLNGAINLAKLSPSYMGGGGAELTRPKTPCETTSLACSHKGDVVKNGESPHLSGESVNK